MNDTGPIVDSISALRDLERRKLIALGVRQTKANSLLARWDVRHRMINLVTLVLLAGAGLLFAYSGWKLGLLALIVCGLYAASVTHAAAMWLRVRALQDASLLDQLYAAGLVTIRVRGTGQVVRPPQDWRSVFLLVHRESTKPPE